MDKKKGVYHINAVDEVTQWEVVITVPHIQQEFTIPALKSLLKLSSQNRTLAVLDKHQQHDATKSTLKCRTRTQSRPTISIFVCGAIRRIALCIVPRVVPGGTGENMTHQSVQISSIVTD